MLPKPSEVPERRSIIVMLRPFFDEEEGYTGVPHMNTLRYANYYGGESVAYGVVPLRVR